MSTRSPALLCLRSRVLAAGLLFVLAAGLAPRADAGAFLVPARPGRAVDEAWAVRSLSIDARVRGSRARVTLRQVIVNLSPRTLEAECLIPLPSEALAEPPRLYVDGHPTPIQVHRGDGAREAGIALLRRHRDARLIAYLGADTVRVSPFVLAGGAERLIELTYEQEVTPINGVARLVCGLQGAALAAQDGARFEIDIELDLGAAADVDPDASNLIGTGSRHEIGPVHSPSHAITVRRQRARQAAIHAEGLLSAYEPDFVLFWSTTRSLVGATMLTYWPPGAQRGYFMLVASLSRFADTRLRARNKDIVFAIDTSGSMRGDRLEGVRQGLLRMLGDLQAEDRFNVVGFGSAAERLWPELRTATPARRAEAQAFVRALRPSGGTNIEAALAPLLTLRRTAGRAAFGLLVTDGRATAGETDAKALLAMVDGVPAAARPRLFTLGIGVDIDADLLDRLARASGGRAHYVRPFEPVAPALQRVYESIREPVLSDPEVLITGIEASDVLPARLPELVRGDTLFLTGRYGRGGRAEVLFAEGSGDYTRRAYGTLLWAGVKGDTTWGNFPARIWSLRRIAAGIDRMREVAPNAERDVEAARIVDLSARYGLLTEYTSFLADEATDPGAFVSNVRRTVQLAGDLRAASAAGAFAHALNQATRRRTHRAPVIDQGAWLPQAGGREIARVSWPGLRVVGGRPFYWRRGLGWVDGEVVGLGQVQEEIARWSPRFYTLLTTTTPEENARLAQRGSLILRVGEKVLRIVDDR